MPTSRNGGNTPKHPNVAHLPQAGKQVLTSEQIIQVCFDHLKLHEEAQTLLTFVTTVTEVCCNKEDRHLMNFEALLCALQMFERRFDGMRGLFQQIAEGGRHASK